ncbi:hypothetical protein [Paenibacillus tianjinensis]|uniref:Uncharacterized protein n=1 Tax=Paenibacillus tianjinensis TaxID=2810347 RepID=A0ABX7LBR9_9BACL|nr:hypothetical protein [Paenibacillus tianjinensis]QSF43427.1 hypothetical protein JRJ22_19375 [Paenibacillus tianjinensis]
MDIKKFSDEKLQTDYKNAQIKIFEILKELEQEKYDDYSDPILADERNDKGIEVDALNFYKNELANEMMRRLCGLDE